MRRIRTLVAAGAVIALGGLLLPAGGSALNRVVADCYAHNGVLRHHYTVRQLQQSLGKIPPDIAEYTNCPDVIREALDTAVSKVKGAGTGARSGGSSFLPAWLIVVIVLVLLGGVGATIAARRRR